MAASFNRRPTEPRSNGVVMLSGVVLSRVCFKSMMHEQKEKEDHVLHQVRTEENRGEPRRTEGEPRRLSRQGDSNSGRPLQRPCEVRIR